MKQKRNYLVVVMLVSIGLLIINSCNKSDDCTQLTWYQDSDGDSFGNSNNSQQSCTQPIGYVSDNTDFDDTNGAAFPGATELCNGIDDNGNGIIDENPSGCGVGEVCENGSCVSANTYYKDVDGDGFGNPNDTIIAGSAPTGYVADNTDCDDLEASTYPGAPENTTDGIDNNCNGWTDETLCVSDSDCPSAIPTCTDQGNNVWICL